MISDYERVRNQFNATALCRYDQRPSLDYEPGCLYVECAKGDECKCCMACGDGGATSAFLIKWRERFAK